jgi:hypothetical protein
MAWVFDPSKRVYRDGERVVTEKQLLALRNAIADGMTAESTSLAQRLVDGVLSLVEWARGFADVLRHGIGASFLLGRGGRSQVSAADSAVLDRLIGEQLDFARGFATELAPALDAGTATVEGVAARSALYSGASVQAFDHGRAGAWSLDLPYFPADHGTSCKSNCRCEWSIEEFDDRIEATWYTAGDDGVCDGCRARGNQYGPGSPFTQAKQTELGL